jgi:hypothetical protein
LKKFIILLYAFYFIFPIIITYLLPSYFYIFSSFQKSSIKLVFISFPIFILFFIVLSFIQEIKNFIYIPKLSKQILRILFILMILHLFILLFIGVQTRINVGSDRLILFHTMQKFLFSGVGFIYVSGLLYSVLYLKNREFYLLLILLFILDYLFMGKHFSFYVISLLLFKADMFKNKKLFYKTLFIGFFIVILIFILRAYASFHSFQEVGINLYSISSEFIGVFSSIGWAMEFYQHINHFFNIDRDLSLYYISYVGHGLALHPLAYFYIISKANIDLFVYLIFIYLIFIWVLLKIFSSIIGNISIFIMLVNIIQFYRNGPDIYLKSFITQSLFITFIIVLPNILLKIKRGSD